MTQNGRSASKQQDPIAEELPEATTVPIPHAYKTLLPLTSDNGRARMNQVHVSAEGYAISTQGHILGVLPVDAPSGAYDLPAKNLHKTDSVEANGDGRSLMVKCGHKQDRSGIVEAKPASEEREDSFPDIGEVWPDTHEDLRIRLNADYLRQLLDVLSDGDETAVTLHFCAETAEQENGDEPALVGIAPTKPVKVKSSRGVGLVMPMRMT